jgi:predicted RNase H-like nuclease (RuvC/YqgF family)
MSDIQEYERRISAALGAISERISAGLGGIDGGSVSALEEALEAERTVNAQLEERVRAIKVKQEETIAQLEKRVASLQENTGHLEGDVSRLKGVNAQLRENNAALRDANAATLGDAHLINKSMLAELEALRATQNADRHELDGLLGELGQIIEEDA